MVIPDIKAELLSTDKVGNKVGNTSSTTSSIGINFKGTICWPATERTYCDPCRWYVLLNKLYQFVKDNFRHANIFNPIGKLCS